MQLGRLGRKGGAETIRENFVKCNACVVHKFGMVLYNRYQVEGYYYGCSVGKNEVQIQNSKMTKKRKYYNDVNQRK